MLTKKSHTATATKLGWFALYWLASVLALGIVAYAIRLAIN